MAERRRSEAVIAEASMSSFRGLHALLLAVVLTVGGAVATAPPAEAATCSTGYLWTTHQNGFKFDAVTKEVHPTLAGTKFCPVRRPAWNDNDGPKGWFGWALNSTSTRWYTAISIPPRGAGSGTDSRVAGRMIADLADHYNVRVQFAERDGAGRAGYTSSTGWQITGTYGAPAWSGGKKGSGIIRLGVGTSRLGAPVNDAAYRKNLKKVFIHELGHIKIEIHCGTHAPSIAGSRVEHVMDAYSTYYLGMTSANYGFTENDLWRAKQIHGGRCA